MSVPIDSLPADPQATQEIYRFDRHIGLEQLRESFRILEPGRYPRVLLDLEDCTHLDVLPMLWLLTVVNKRTEKWDQTSFRLPRSRRLRRSLRMQNFPEALSQVAGAPYRLLVDRPEEDEFGDTTGTPAWASVPVGGQILPHLQTEGIFGMSVHRLNQATPDVQPVDRELARWRDPLTLAVLDRCLKGEPLDIPRIIIHTLLVKLWTRSDATTGIVASQLRLPRRGQAELVIAAWDDGDSAADELRVTLDRQGAPAEPREECTGDDPEDSDPATLYSQVVHARGGHLDIFADSVGIALGADPTGQSPYCVQHVEPAAAPWKYGNLTIVYLPIHDDF